MPVLLRSVTQAIFKFFSQRAKCCLVFSIVALVALVALVTFVHDARAAIAVYLLHATSSLSSSLVAASHCVNKPSNSSSTKGLPR
jgi:hypothetical protein